MKTMQQIADELGLSRATVSLCLSNAHHEYRISAATVQRVRDYADNVGFVPNRMAGVLGKLPTPPVGLLIDQSSNFEKNAPALSYAMRTLHGHKRDFVIQGFVKGRLLQTVRQLRSMQVREIILFDTLSELAQESGKLAWRTTDSEVPKLNALLSDVEFFSVDYDFPVPEKDFLKNIYRLGINRSATMIALLEELREAGQGNFFCEIDESEEPEFFRRRLIVDRRQILRSPVAGGNPFELGARFGEMVLHDYAYLQARTVMVRSDRVAVGLIDKLLQHHVAVPGEIQVIGFDNIVDAPYFRVPLTTVEVPVLAHTKKVLEHILLGHELPQTLQSSGCVVWRESARIG